MCLKSDHWSYSDWYGVEEEHPVYQIRKQEQDRLGIIETRYQKQKGE